MKQALMVPFLLLFSIAVDAQTSGSGTGTSQGGKAGAQVKKGTTPAKGATEYHGSKDTTPGSPMGTGGAGGNEMSGSPKGSAAESAIQSTKPDQQPAAQAVSQDSSYRKVNKKGKTAGNKNTPR